MKSNLATAFLFGLAGAALLFAPPAVTQRVRTSVRDAIRPGLSVVDRAVDEVEAVGHKIVPPPDHARELARFESAVEQWKHRCRRLRIENARLNERLAAARRQQIGVYTGTTGQPLVVPELLEATVLGHEITARGPLGRLIDRGRADGLVESDLVVGDAGLLLDQGEDAGLKTGQPVYSGRRIVGSIARVGRWTSTVVPVTDPAFRGHAQILRKTSRGHVFGPRGVLKGTGGPLCRLELVAANEAVDVGDEVYTADGDSMLPYPMYYGRVVEAELEPGGLHWQIGVEPAAREPDVKTVQVLRTRLNPARITAN